MADQIRVKASLGKDHRRFRLSEPHTQLSDLQLALTALFEPPTTHRLKLSWGDSDGDQINVKTESDWAEAIRVAASEQPRQYWATPTVAQKPPAESDRHGGVAGPARAGAGAGEPATTVKLTVALETLPPTEEQSSALEESADPATDASGHSSGHSGGEHDGGSGDDGLTLSGASNSPTPTSTPSPLPTAPQWCFKGGDAYYIRTGRACTIVAVHPPMPGDTTTFVTIAFDDEGGGSTRETSVDKLSPEPAAVTTSSSSTSPAISAPPPSIRAGGSGDGGEAPTAPAEQEQAFVGTGSGPAATADGVEEADDERAFVDTFSKYQSQIREVVAMGFSNLPAIGQLLVKHAGSVERVLDEILAN